MKIAKPEIHSEVSANKLKWFGPGLPGAEHDIDEARPQTGVNTNGIIPVVNAGANISDGGRPASYQWS
ncbi:MAG: hypothetical protein O7D36_07310, partial [Gammaproteobacteria bacterium]|nr:hypothetical protein [Gammaproteobacteria bacterium]